MLYDTVILDGSSAVVRRSAGEARGQRLLALLLPAGLALLCAGVGLNARGSWKYLAIPACVVFYLIFRFSWLPARQHEEILRIDRKQLVYTEPGVQYVVPLAALETVEDRSKYFDFHRRENRSWEHCVALKVRENCHITCITEDGEEQLRATRSAPVELLLNGMTLKHEDFTALYAFLTTVLENRL